MGSDLEDSPASADGNRAVRETSEVALKRKVTLINAIGLIVGNIIGSGIFISPKGVLEEAGTVGVALIIWAISGVISAIGALCYADLGTAIPRSGGDYSYILDIFGPLPAFLRLWVELIIVRPATHAVIALTFAFYILYPVYEPCPPPNSAVTLLAALCIYAELLEDYWWRGYNYAEISQLLLRFHNIDLDVRQLKYRFSKLGLCRYGNAVPDDTVLAAIREELQGPNRHYGYRRMWRCLVSNHRLNVRRSTVQRLLRQEDPVGSAQRRRRRLARRRYFSLGPNMVWHIDGNDKLKAYGFFIHGCIDGYSRRVLWLKVGSTNKDAKVVAGFYLDAVCELGGCPLIVRSDPGSENVVVAALQSTFREHAEDDFAGTRSHQYGKSVHNQRIEAFWSHLKPKLLWWGELFQGLVDNGDFESGNVLHTWCLQYCFMSILANDLDNYAEHWNDRRIPQHHSASVPGGRPNVLHFMPEQTGGRNMLQAVPGGMLQAARRHSKPNSSVGDERFHAYAVEMTRRLNRAHPQNTTEAIELYMDLVEISTDM